MKIKYIFLAVAALILAALPFCYRFLDYSFGNCLKGDVVVKVYPGDNVDSLLVRLSDSVKDCDSFRSYYNSFFDASIKEGNYALEEGISERRLLRILANGYQTPVNVIFNNVNDIQSLAGKVSKCLLVDSITLLKYLNNPSVWKEYSLSKATFPILFIPNTYQMYWTDSPEKFVKRMASEYHKFWNKERMDKAKALNLSAEQVVIIASIVDKETNYAPDRTNIAGVYINRLRAGMLLQADPTVKFANGDMSLRRVLNKHLEKDSPYNTYKYAGLPPGPISIPDGKVIDAVLNYKGHKYYYFCADADLSGKSVFSENLSKHSKNAKAYQGKLNKLKIR